MTLWRNESSKGRTKEQQEERKVARNSEAGKGKRKEKDSIAVEGLVIPTRISSNMYVMTGCGQSHN